MSSASASRRGRRVEAAATWSRASAWSGRGAHERDDPLALGCRGDGALEGARGPGRGRPARGGRRSSARARASTGSSRRRGQHWPGRRGRATPRQPRGCAGAAPRGSAAACTPPAPLGASSERQAGRSRAASWSSSASLGWVRGRASVQRRQSASRPDAPPRCHDGQMACDDAATSEVIDWLLAGDVAVGLPGDARPSGPRRARACSSGSPPRASARRSWPPDGPTATGVGASTSRSGPRATTRCCSCATSACPPTIPRPARRSRLILAREQGPRRWRQPSRRPPPSDACINGMALGYAS